MLHSGGFIIKNGVVYKYIDADKIVKYVGLVRPGNSFLNRIIQHRNDEWYHDGFKIYYIELATQTDCEFCESFFINHYKTYNYYNTAKSSWGSSSFINADDFTWKEFNESDFQNEFVSEKKSKKNKKLSEKAFHDVSTSAKNDDKHLNIAKIPKDIILDNSMGKKRAIFTAGAYFLMNKFFDIKTTCSDFVRMFGYKPNHQKGRINDEAKAYFKSLSGIYAEEKGNQRGAIHLSMLPSFTQPSLFAMIYSHEYANIIEHSKGISMSIAFLVLAYIRLRLYKNASGKDEKPEMYFCLQSNITNALDINIRALHNAINLLSELDIIHCDQMQRYRDKNNNWHTGLTVFVNKHRYINGVEDKKYDWKREMERSKNYIYKSQEQFLKNNS